jgi:hypothetical protein
VLLPVDRGLGIGGVGQALVVERLVAGRLPVIGLSAHGLGQALKVDDSLGHAPLDRVAVVGIHVDGTLHVLAPHPAHEHSHQVEVPQQGFGGRRRRRLPHLSARLDEEAGLVQETLSEPGAPASPGPIQVPDLSGGQT